MLNMKSVKRAISCIMALAILFTGSPAVVTANELFSNDIQKYKSSISTSQRSDLAPSTIAENKTSQENYVAAELILSEKAHNAFIRRQIEKIVAARGVEGLQEKQIKIDGSDMLVIAIPSLLRGTGNFAHVGLGRQYGRAVIYVDADMFNSDENLNAIVRHEAFEISQWETMRKNLGLEPEQMRGWIRTNIDKPVSETVLAGTKYAKSTNMTVRELARQIHNDAESLEKLYEKYGDKIKIKADYIAKLVTLYHEDGAAVTPDEILYDAQKTLDLTVAAGRAPPVNAAIGGSKADKAARDEKVSWIEENKPELKGKLIVSLSMEGNIPEFKGYGNAQRANTKGGLGAYFGDKLEGFASVGLKAIGIQPGYSHVMIDGKKVSVEEDYDKLIAKGIMTPVLTGDNAIMVRAWDEDPEAHTYDDEDKANPNVKVEVYKITRGGTVDYIIRSKVLDELYTKNRVHRFTQEIVFGKAVYELCNRLNIVPDILHLNEAHTVVAAAQMRANQKFDRMAIAYTNHTLVAAGLETFPPNDVNSNINRMMYVIGLPGEVAPRLNSIFLKNGKVDFCYAAAMLADIINGVSKEHGDATRELFVSLYGEDFNIKMPGILNGSGNVWKNPKILAIEETGRAPTEEEVWRIHEDGKKKAFSDIKKRTGITLDMNKQTTWMVRRLVDYKSQYPILRFLLHIMTADKDKTFTREELKAAWFRDIPDLAKDEEKGKVEATLDKIFQNGKLTVAHGLGQQLVVGCPNPEDSPDWDYHFQRLAGLDIFKGKFVYIRDSESELLRMQSIGADICINCPLDLLEACGTSDQRTGLNGGINIALRGAGPVEWIEDYNERLGAGSGFLYGPYTFPTDKGLAGDKERFYKEAPGDIFGKLLTCARLYSEPGKAAWRHLMYNSYLAANKLVTAAAMEKRYSQDVYPQAIHNRTDTKTIYEMVLRDYYDGKAGTSGLENALKELPFLAEAGVKTIYLLGLMEHTGRPFEILNPRNIDPRAGTFGDLGKFTYAAKRAGIKVLAVDWLANQHVSKSSPVCTEHPERFLYTNASDGNYYFDRDSKLVKGRDLPVDELKKRIELGKKINSVISGMQKEGILEETGELEIDGRKIAYHLGDKNIRAKVKGVDASVPAVVVSSDDALFLVSATDLVSLKTALPRRWTELAQPDLSHPDVVNDAIATGRFWLEHGLQGFRVDAALSTFPDRIKENWGVDVQENLTKRFIDEMRKIDPDCFFLFEAFDRQDELLKFADNKYAAAYKADSRDLTTYALTYPKDGNNMENLIAYLRQLESDPARNNLVNLGPEHDASDFRDAWARLGYQDRNLLYFLYSVLPGYHLIFNGEIYGSQHNFKNATSASVPNIDSADAQRKEVRKELFSFGIFNRSIPYGQYKYLETDKPENGIGVARFDDSGEIVVGALNVTANDGWTTLGMRRVINAQVSSAELPTTSYVKESFMLSKDGTKWVRLEAMTIPAETLFKYGLAVHIGPKACEMIRLTKVTTPVVSKGSPAAGLTDLYKNGFFDGKKVAKKEFAKIRGYSESTVRIELDTLVRLGLVVQEKEGNTYTYHLNDYFGRAPPAEAQAAIEKIAAIPEMNLFDPKEHIVEIKERIAEILPAQALSSAGVSGMAADTVVSEFGSAVKSDVDATLAFFASDEIAPGLNDGMIHVIRYNETRLRECPLAVDILKAYVELLKTRSVHKNNIILIPTTAGLITVHSYKDKDAYAQNNPTGEGVIDMQGSLSDQDLKVTRLVNMAIAASHIRRDIPLAQMEDAENRLLDYIRKQYEIITGKAASPGQILEFIKDLPRSLPLPTKRIEEYNKLTVRQLEQAA